MAQWISSRDDFDSCRVDGVLHNWEASVAFPRLKKMVSWASPSEGDLKFNLV